MKRWIKKEPWGPKDSAWLEEINKAIKEYARLILFGRRQGGQDDFNKVWLDLFSFWDQLSETCRLYPAAFFRDTAIQMLIMAVEIENNRPPDLQFIHVTKKKIIRIRRRLEKLTR